VTEAKHRSRVMESNQELDFAVITFTAVLRPILISKVESGAYCEAAIFIDSSVWGDHAYYYKCPL